MNRPPTPDRSAPHGLAAPPGPPAPAWPETGLPPYGDSAYGDTGYGGASYGEAGYGEPGYGDAGHASSACGDAGYGGPGYPASGYDGPGHGGPGYDGPGHSGPGHSGPACGNVSYGDSASDLVAAHAARTARTSHDRALRPAPQRSPGAPDAPRTDSELRVVVPQPGLGAAPGRRPQRAIRPAAGGRPRVGGRLPRTGVLAAADCVAALVGLCVVGPDGAPVLPAALLCVLLAAHRRTGLYRPALAPATLDEVPAIALGTVLAWGLAAAALAASAPHRALGWTELLDATALTGCTAVALRALVHRLRRGHARRAPAATLVIGPPPAAHRLAHALRDHPEYGLAPVAVADVRDELGRPDAQDRRRLPAAEFAATARATARPGPATDPFGVPAAAPAPHRFDPDVFAAPADRAAPLTTAAAPLPQFTATASADLARAAAHHRVRHIVLVGPPGPATETALELLAARGCRIWQVDPAQERPGGDRAGTRRPPHLWGHAYRPARAGRRTPHPGKRALDIALATLALAATAPVLAGCALAVRLADGPGVLFRQERIGLDGQPFTLLKFRTLRPRDDHESATLWNVAHDDRMGPVGRLLRRTSMDELPQLWNVLRGDMSLVGPRPERPFFVQQFSAELPGYQDRHRMPAGITGLAQVHGLRGDTSIPDRVRFDNHYIDSWSLWQDVAILLRTAASLFRLGGS